MPEPTTVLAVTRPQLEVFDRALAWSLKCDAGSGPEDLTCEQSLHALVLDALNRFDIAEPPAGQDRSPPVIPSEVMTKLRQLYAERRATGIWPTTKGGKLTKAGADMALDWVVGACAGMIAVGAPAPTGTAFLASVRGADEVMVKEDITDA